MTRMHRLQEFQCAALENGYAVIDEFKCGNTVWLRKVVPDGGTDVHKRLCIDGLTDSATVFWQTAVTKVNSKTFRSVPSLRNWFSTTDKQA
jgi:hypothetical protein